MTKDELLNERAIIKDDLFNDNSDSFVKLMNHLYSLQENKELLNNTIEILNFDLSDKDKINILRYYSQQPFPATLILFSELFLSKPIFENTNLQLSIVQLTTESGSNSTFNYLVKNNYLQVEEITSQPQTIGALKFYIDLIPLVDIDNYKFKTFFFSMLERYTSENFMADPKPHSLDNLIPLFSHLSIENQEFMVQAVKQEKDNLSLEEKEQIFN